MVLDQREEAFLKSIQENPLWQSILRKMQEFSSTPRYQHGKDDSQQVSDWKYLSGRLDEREAMLSLLKLSKVRVSVEK